ncbi:HAD family phosphatase [Bifidobacterium psychraerophilum]|jgi:putative hydrolase of the HAD superfamily|uniref:HAD-superfamily hydrolase n=1 Tax=Bifidobacterium psychraerophilum TaxID=218140 RepID=A0A087CGS0_9BIFI|nr:HAD family phosphatase [Bifidobacterium psychraerophilum]KFI82470.1 HAD-superfamily hydrolase [Bifidobacterium psychraerophilum]MCI1661223.1 HAD family phosphatase [Bifidobacterium psychraerophilum]MCI1805143.1 HAD family phosphatase [Bifidobacterium psychraerophilum]MCI2175657.1 HAD family phosphatase [Bifidobacterium psychraerophilum]MCI2181663.1 HAD family phosphatase [Bifidobacterium psychraerophilum]
MKGWPNEPDMENDVIIAEGNAASAAGNPISDVIFDFGNVLVYWDPAAVMISRYSEESIERFLDNDISGFYDANDRLDGGDSCDETVAWLRETRGDHWADMFRFYCDNFVDSQTGVVPGSRKLIEDLKAVGIHTWGLSNWSAELFPIAWERHEILHSLDGKVVSGPIKLRKPGVEIYRYLLDRFGIDPIKSVFIDDKAMNIVGANEAGIRGIRFTDPYKLRALLIESGIDIPAVQ